MMATISSYTRQWQARLRGVLGDPRTGRMLRLAAPVVAGFLLSAASLSGAPQPLVLGALCAVSGEKGLLLGLGGLLGYPAFWGIAGLQGMAWTVWGMVWSWFLGESPLGGTPYLFPALAALGVSACGLGFQLWLGDETGIGMYALQVVLAAAAGQIFRLARGQQDAVAQWAAGGLCVLALAQVAPVSWLSLGYLAMGAAAVAGAFPAAALAGLALDLSGITRIPMTAVACLIYLARLIPFGSKWAVYLSPGPVCLLVMSLCSVWDLTALPMLAAGGLAGMFLPGQPQTARRRGPTAVAQVRLEMVSEVFSQTRQLLLEADMPPVDEDALLRRGAERACGSCPARKTCKERDAALTLPGSLLHRPLLDSADLNLSCRKSGRFLAELHRSQEQLRSIRADRQRQKEYRAALIQQYRFLSDYLQALSDDLGRREKTAQPRFRVEVSVSGNRPEEDNGDRCQWFAGVGCRYYVVLCDGMGTGIGAVEEGSQALALLRRLLSAGYPAEHALRSLNSLCALRNRAGAVTVDLAELRLDTGYASIYKWGAAASWVLGKNGPEKIGTATPPPGLSVEESRETVEKLSLRRGEVLLLVSDGVGGEDALRSCVFDPEQSPGELAAAIVSAGGGGTDDATVAAIRLCSRSLSA